MAKVQLSVLFIYEPLFYAKLHIINTEIFTTGSLFKGKRPHLIVRHLPPKAVTTLLLTMFLRDPGAGAAAAGDGVY